MYNGLAIFNNASSFQCLDKLNLAGILIGNRAHYENRHRWSSSLWVSNRAGPSPQQVVSGCAVIRSKLHKSTFDPRRVQTFRSELG